MKKVAVLFLIAGFVTLSFLPRDLFAKTSLHRRSTRVTNFDSFDDDLYVDLDHRPLEENY